MLLTHDTPDGSTMYSVGPSLELYDPSTTLKERGELWSSCPMCVCVVCVCVCARARVRMCECVCYSPAAKGPDPAVACEQMHVPRHPVHQMLQQEDNPVIIAGHASRHDTQGSQVGGGVLGPSTRPLPLHKMT